MIRAAARTATGCFHDDNQDRVGIDADRGTFIVVDGVGGLADAGATAQAVAERLPLHVSESVALLDGPGVVATVTKVVAELNDQLRTTARTGPGTTGATAAMLLIRDGSALVVHLGDSRVYLYRGRQLRRLTADHVRGGELTTFLGMAGDVSPDVAVHELRAGDLFVLCTDGLTGSVPDTVLAELLDGPDEVDGVCVRLVQAAARGGAADDVSVIAVGYGAVSDGAGGGGDGAAQHR